MRYLLLAAALLSLVGCGAAAVSGPSSTPLPTPNTSAPVATSIAIPRHISIPVIGVDADLIALGKASDGTPEEPDVNTPEVPAWYSPGVKPGEVGPAVISGHVNGGGQVGVFGRLKQLTPGGVIWVDDKRFVVYAVDTVLKNEFPEHAVFGETAGPELRLITCGGELNRAIHSYKSNVIVSARAA